MTTEHDIKKTALIISKYLPIWNYSLANCADEKQVFDSHVRALDYQKDSAELWQDFADLIEKYVPDNHIELRVNGKNLVNKKIPTTRQDITKDVPQTHQAILISPDKGSWYIGTNTVGKKKIGVVTIPFLSYSEGEKEETRNQFVNTFFKMKKENNWAGIIFDFRGNTGGDADVIKQIAEQMGGKSVVYASKTEQIRPKQDDPYQHLFKPQETQIISSIITDNNEDRFSGPIYVLQDGWNASAAEGAIYMLKQLNNVTTIGEKTSGTYQSGNVVSVNINENVELCIGTHYRERLDKKHQIIKEKDGMKADIPCPSNKAFKKALMQFKMGNNHLIRSFCLLSKLFDLLPQKKSNTALFNTSKNQR